MLRQDVRINRYQSYSLILPSFDFVLLFEDSFIQTLKEKIRRLQNRAARIMIEPETRVIMLLKKNYFLN